MKRLSINVILVMILLFLSFNGSTETSSIDWGKEWGEFYWKVFEIKSDYSQVEIPTKPEGKADFDFLIIIDSSITLDAVVAKCKGMFEFWSVYDDLEKISDDRDPKGGHYAVWIRSRTEADKELRDMSVDDVTKQNIHGITLLERLIFEIYYFSEIGKKKNNKLDMFSATFCSGSRHSKYNEVPTVFRDDSSNVILWFHDSDFKDKTRAVREVIY